MSNMKTNKRIVASVLLLVLAFVGSGLAVSAETQVDSASETGLAFETDGYVVVTAVDYSIVLKYAKNITTSNCYYKTGYTVNRLKK